ncbi:hypothetical protein T11_9981 [Trichinella zimbabwensis]|uniref:Uncharacterized protein n=1 Tax=Trichinella zimbabwensis TaxID=268475 RepID=A0A0V1I8V8_9BILA|nr:hypothetical protein T11_9981 [Trichinella zimbabwensis]
MSATCIVAKKFLDETEAIKSSEAKSLLKRSHQRFSASCNSSNDGRAPKPTTIRRDLDKAFHLPVARRCIRSESFSTRLRAFPLSSQLVAKSSTYMSERTRSDKRHPRQPVSFHGSLDTRFLPKEAIDIPILPKKADLQRSGSEEGWPRDQAGGGGQIPGTGSARYREMLRIRQKPVGMWSWISHAGRPRGGAGTTFFQHIPSPSPRFCPTAVAERPRGCLTRTPPRLSIRDRRRSTAASCTNLIDSTFQNVPERRKRVAVQHIRASLSIYLVAATQSPAGTLLRVPTSGPKVDVDPATLAIVAPFCASLRRTITISSAFIVQNNKEATQQI